MEDNQCVILDRYPSNQLITKIQMTSNIMFPMTLKPSMKRKTMQVVYEENDVHSDTAFKEESEEVSVHCSKEVKVSVHSSKREEDNGTKLHATFQKCRMILGYGISYLDI
jgi:hypothetical protein